MGTREFDVLVIGEGLAGTMASAAAATEGAHVALVSKGPGSFVLADDCFDFDAVDFRAVESDDGFRRELQFFLKIAAAAGCEYHGWPNEKIRVPTILGTFRDVTLAPLYFDKYDPLQLKEVVVVGLSSIHDWDANFIAERLSSKARQEHSDTMFRAHQLQISSDQLQVSLPNGPPRLEIQFAAQFDRNPRFREAVIRALASAVSNADLMIVPGVLGINTTTDELAELGRQVGCPICEVATLPPSVLGIRLLRRFEHYLAKIGVERFTGFAVSELWSEGERYRGVVLDTPGRKQRVEARALVVATGAFSHLFEANTAGAMPKNVFICGGALRASDPRSENAVAIITGCRAGTRAANVGVQYAGR
jgi:glycerol-3-phosphate dehydrogenase subunit B